MFWFLLEPVYKSPILMGECCGQSASKPMSGTAVIIVAGSPARVLRKLLIGERTRPMEVMNSGKYFGRDSKGLELPIIGIASISVGALA
jgi:hypothetical protein